MRAECLDEESWLQEYCCIPVDESSAFITYELIHACESPGCLKPFSYILGSTGDSPVAVGDPPNASESLSLPTWG